MLPPNPTNNLEAALHLAHCTVPDVMDSLRVTRERNALQTALKELKRTQVQELCHVKIPCTTGVALKLTREVTQIHSISNTQRTKVALDAELVEHFVNE